MRQKRSDTWMTRQPKGKILLPLRRCRHICPKMAVSIHPNLGQEVVDKANLNQAGTHVVICPLSSGPICLYDFSRVCYCPKRQQVQWLLVVQTDHSSETLCPHLCILIAQKIPVIVLFLGVLPFPFNLSSKPLC